MSFDFSTLITDRSQADVEALRALLSTALTDWTAEQLAAFNQAASRGAYNYTDLNRVTAAMDDLNERLTALGYETGYQQIVVPHREMPSSRLPEGYQEVEYIQSSGTQYIDTGFKPNQDTRIVMDVYVQTQASFPKVIFGGRNGDISSVDSFVFWAMTSTTLRTDYGDPTLSIAVTPSGRFAIDKNKNVTVLNGTSYTQNNATFQSGYNLAIFSLLDPGGVDVRMCSMKLYSCQLYDNGTLIRDYVPCTGPSAAVGLYDLVGGVFYGNAGTGTFTSGEIVYEVNEELDPYLWYEQDVPTESAMEAYLANVSALRKVLTLPETSAAAPENMNGLTMEEANAIEEIVATIEAYLLAMSKIFLRSGMTWAVSGGPGFYFVN